MAKAAPSVFADAKRRALRALAQQHSDGFVPDRVQFFNEEHGFMVRISNLSDDHHCQKMVTWTEVQFSSAPVIELTVDAAVEMLARTQGEKI